MCWGGCWDPLLVIAVPEDSVSDYVAACRATGQKPFLDGPHFELSRACRHDRLDQDSVRGWRRSWPRSSRLWSPDGTSAFRASGPGQPSPGIRRLVALKITHLGLEERLRKPRAPFLPGAVADDRNATHVVLVRRVELQLFP